MVRHLSVEAKKNRECCVFYVSSPQVYRDNDWHAESYTSFKMSVRWIQAQMNLTCDTRTHVTGSGVAPTVGSVSRRNVPKLRQFNLLFFFNYQRKWRNLCTILRMTDPTGSATAPAFLLHKRWLIYCLLMATNRQTRRHIVCFQIISYKCGSSDFFMGRGTSKENSGFSMAG